jgi:hypothetical protein
MTYEYDKIIHKIKKYKIKYNNTNITNKKKYYIQKIIYYNQYINHQNGGGDNDIEAKGEGLPNLIKTHRIKLGEDVGRTIKEITDLVNRTSQIDDETITKLTTGINTIKDNYSNVKQQLVSSTTEFAKYNAETRESFNAILALVKRLRPLDDNTIQLIMGIIKEMSELDFIGIEWNQELIVELGVLMSDHKDTSANMTLDRIDMIFSKQGDIEIYKTVKEFFNTIVKPRIDEISKKEKYTIKTFSRFAELSKNFV